MPGVPRYYRNPDAMWREEDGRKELAVKGLEQGESAADIGVSIVLMNGMIHSLNILGTEIWKLCDGKSREEIISILGEQFEVDSAVLEADLGAFLSEMKGHGLVYEK